MSISKYLLFVSLFMLNFACKKTVEEPAKIKLRQQPSKILIYAMDSASKTEVLEQTFLYYYNNTQERYDSIIASGLSFTFNYDSLNSAQKILLNYTDGHSPYSEIQLDGQLNALKSLRTINPADTFQNKSYVFSYEIDSRITGLKAFGVSTIYQKNLTYKDDSLFIETHNISSSCTTTDTLINTARTYLNTKLPYLLFADIDNTCSGNQNALLSALSTSNYAYKLPLKVVNGTITKDYRYTFDKERRMGKADITIRNSTTPSVVSIIRMELSY